MDFVDRASNFLQIALLLAILSRLAESHVWGIIFLSFACIVAVITLAYIYDEVKK